MRVLARHPGGHAMRPFCPVVAVATIFAGGGMSSDGRGVGSWNFPTADVRPVIATSGDRARHVRGVAFRTRDERRAEEALNLSVEKYCSVSHCLRPDLPVTHAIEIFEDSPSDD